MTLAASAVKSHLAELAVQLSCVWLAESDSTFGKKIDVEGGMAELFWTETLQPGEDFGLEFHCTPGHSSDAMEGV